MSVISDGVIRQLLDNERICVVESGQVYDVTEFAKRHPGGKEIIKEHAGCDVTDILNTPSLHKHSTAAYSILRKFKIGHHDARSPDLSEDELVDWERPLMWQVAGLREKYFDWVHRPVDRHIRLFKSDLVEYFSNCPWYMVPLVWLPMAVLLFWLSLVNFESRHWHLIAGVQVCQRDMPILICVGALLWTLAEYIIHRWLFHLRPPTNIPLLIQFHFLMHGQHHKTPMDSRRLVFPPIPASGLALAIYCVYSSLLAAPVAQAVMVGTILGYMTYDLTHYYLHHGTPAIRYFTELKRYHVMHHYVDQQNGFGISSKLWDYPFGTLIKEAKEKDI